jgi:hypothetical protein
MPKYKQLLVKPARFIEIDQEIDLEFIDLIMIDLFGARTLDLGIEPVTSAKEDPYLLQKVIESQTILLDSSFIGDSSTMLNALLEYAYRKDIVGRTIINIRDFDFPHGAIDWKLWGEVFKYNKYIYRKSGTCDLYLHRLHHKPELL